MPTWEPHSNLVDKFLAVHKLGVATQSMVDWAGDNGDALDAYECAV